MAVQWAKRKVGTNAQKRQRVANPTTSSNSLKQKIDLEVTKESIDRQMETKVEDPQSALKDDTRGKKKPMQNGNDDKRQTIIMDYQKDICTQYFKTGRCRYGDACKFSHERGSKPSIQKDPGPSEPPIRMTQCSECASEEELLLPTCSHIYCESCFLKMSKDGKPCVSCLRPLKSAKTL